MTTCYGCENKFPRSMNDPPPPEPYDLVLCRKQARVYVPKATTGLHFSLKLENVFFHLRRSCVEMKNSDRVTGDSLVFTEVENKTSKHVTKRYCKRNFQLLYCRYAACIWGVSKVYYGDCGVGNCETEE